ncbi:hypothetical protein [Absidia glauca]|uniref:Uncharacterized protein n=1 Tax=Absidia glauca TaxID=4829 RepID=A0A168M2F8_ABSGL|nr:hypothetical protein [Absidia glauca]
MGDLDTTTSSNHTVPSIGGYKRVLKSTKDTGVEVTNVLVEKAAMNHIAINRADTTDDDFSTSSFFKSTGKIDTGTASDMVMRTPGLTSEMLGLLGAGMNTIITTSTKLESNSETYTSASHKSNSKRKRHSMIFRVIANRYARRNHRRSEFIDAFYFGDVHFFIMCHGRHYACTTVYQMQYDSDNHMYYTAGPRLPKKTVLLRASSLVGEAGSFSVGYRYLGKYIFWKSMVLGWETKSRYCGRLEWL